LIEFCELGLLTNNSTSFSWPVLRIFQEFRYEIRKLANFLIREFGNSQYYERFLAKLKLREITDQT